MTSITYPRRFTGTADERIVNRLTHHFIAFEEDEPAECADCCARTYHAAADYPCGVEPARITLITIGGEA